MKIENPDQGEFTFTFADGSTRKATELETCYVGKGTYLPGWKWSKDTGRQTGKPSERHIEYILSGSFMVIDENGDEHVVKAGEAFEVDPRHDGWEIRGHTLHRP